MAVIGGGPLTKAGVPTSGVAQVETVNVVGTISTAGDATITVTAAGMTGSPIAVSVAVALNDTATIVATKIAAAMTAHAVIGVFFTITSLVADAIFTAKKAAANDATMNIAFTNGTCAGLTPDATSTDTTAGIKGDYRGMEYGTIVADTTNTNLYQNLGTVNVPTWTLL